MIQFATFVNNNARRWERGERDHLACASALLLACGATDAPTNADNLKRLTEQVSGLSNNAAFRSGQLAMQSLVYAAISDIADSPESLDRHAVIGKLRRRLNSEFDTLNRSASFAATGKVVPSQTSLEKENARLREENAELSRQLAARRPAQVVDTVGTYRPDDLYLRDDINSALVDAANTVADRTVAHGVQAGNLATAVRLAADTIRRFASAIKTQRDVHRASLAALDKHRVELQVALNKVLDPGEPAVNADTMAQAVDLVGDRLHELRGALAGARLELRKKAFYAPNDTHARGVIDANTHTAKKLKQELAKISGFDVSSIPDYDPVKPGAVTTAVIEAVRDYGHRRYQIGCKDSHAVVDGWLIDMMKGIGCSAEELVDLVAETKREGNGDKAFEVAKTIILRRVIDECRLQRLSNRIRGLTVNWMTVGEFERLLQHLGLWRE